MKPRLLISTDNFQPRHDGIASFLAEIIPRLLNDYEITVVSPDYGVAPIDMQIRRILIPIKKKAWGDYVPAQWRPEAVDAAVKDADLVFCQTIGPIGIAAHRAARKRKKPLIAFIHSIEWELVPRALNNRLLKKLAYPLTKFLTKHLYNKCSLLIVPSKNTAELLTWQGISTKKKVVHLGVDTKRFTKGDRAAMRKQLKIPKDAFLVGFHGRIGYEKNLLTLTRGFLRMQHKNKKLLLVGDGVPELKERLKKVRGCIMPGAQENVVPYLQALDVYVMPSFTETTSLAVLEAMSCELPVISSPVGFIQQYIKHGQNGFFYETKSALDLARKLELLANDHILRVKTGKEARKTVKEKFDWDIAAELIAETLAQMKRRKS
ncbi:glycosyltransferase family 4 protein [Candidatus Woesearchaeota archaeon]|nr:glycosyltransferase family 4 protein [Candidatus Woesearchaeota archaeon]